MELYGFVYLVDKFYRDAKKADENREEMIKSYREMAPLGDLPNHLKYYFNLPSALYVMLEEIIELRKEVERLKVKE